MNKCILFKCVIYFICCSANLAVAQNIEVYDSVSKQVKDAYNSGDAQKMYALTSTTYQEKVKFLSLSEGTKKFHIKAGRWEDLSFKENVEGGMAYNARFERENQIFFLKLDDQGKILRFNFKPVPFIKSSKTYQVLSNNPLVTRTDSLVEKLVRPYIQQAHTSGLCIAVVQNNVVNRYSYGVTKKEGGDLPNPAHTIFEVGSVTKTFTSLLLANDVVKKRMNLTDPVTKYLPDSIPRRYEAVQLQHLANHTSGFPRLPNNIFLGKVNPADPYKHYNADSLLRFLISHKPSVLPGTEFSYSNYGAGLLGFILATHARKTFEQLVLENICRPLKMHDTRINLTRLETPRLAQGYNERGEATPEWDLSSLQGSGAIKSTLNDMVLYLKAQLGAKPGSLDKAILLTHQVTFEGKENTIGLGWRIYKQGWRTYLHHSGGTGGFRSFVGFDKGRQLGVVILSNTADDVTAIGQAILE